MNDVEQAILRALVELEETTAAFKTTNPKPSLLPIFSRLDELSRQLPSDTAPDLRHYLAKKSYQKARLFLQGRDAENAAGSCGHV